MKIPTVRCSLAVNKSLIKSLTESWKPIVNGAGITFIVQSISIVMDISGKSLYSRSQAETQAWRSFHNEICAL
ncbi:hypothetical protein AFLA_008990 [Aspergillus flavus NRRL3357]|nr:hypothetical protein AFLA_008990 [Aspergillus flavus NRRL3357]